MKSVNDSIRKEYEAFEKLRQAHKKRLKKMKENRSKQLDKVCTMICFYDVDFSDEALKAGLLKIMEAEMSSLSHGTESIQNEPDGAEGRH